MDKNPLGRVHCSSFSQLKKITRNLFDFFPDILYLRFRSIPVNDVRLMHISNVCKQSSPCQHGYFFTLSDGRNVHVTLNAYSINPLIQAISMSRLNSDYEFGHFIKQTPEGDMERPEDTLAKIFSQRE